MVYSAMVSVMSKSVSSPVQRLVNRSKREVETTICTLVDWLLAQHLPAIHKRTPLVVCILDLCVH
jgi:hypothetical protein